MDIGAGFSRERFEDGVGTVTALRRAWSPPRRTGWEARRYRPAERARPRLESKG